MWWVFQSTVYSYELCSPSTFEKSHLHILCKFWLLIFHSVMKHWKQFCLSSLSTRCLKEVLANYRSSSNVFLWSLSMHKQLCKELRKSQFSLGTNYFCLFSTHVSVLTFYAHIFSLFLTNITFYETVILLFTLDWHFGEPIYFANQIDEISGNIYKHLPVPLFLAVQLTSL